MRQNGKSKGKGIWEKGGKVIEVRWAKKKGRKYVKDENRFRITLSR
jgi:hypothetical protein